MGQISPFLRSQHGGYAHYCPGCEEMHHIPVTEAHPNGSRWTFNGDVNRPTFNPSVNIVGQCHYFLHDGQLQFCGDSTHKLSGQTVPLPELPEDWRDPPHTIQKGNGDG